MSAPRQNSSTDFSWAFWLLDGFAGLRRETQQFTPPDEFWTHMHASEREFLLAWRVLIDSALERNARKSGIAASPANEEILVSRRQSIDIEF